MKLSWKTPKFSKFYSNYKTFIKHLWPQRKNEKLCFLSRSTERCPKKKCPGDGFVGKDCKCWCKGPTQRQPAIYCNTRKAVGGGNVIGPKPTKVPTKVIVRGKDRDFHPKCPMWARVGECRKNPNYMLVNCKASCKRVGVVRPGKSPESEQEISVMFFQKMHLPQLLSFLRNLNTDFIFQKQDAEI